MATSESRNSASPETTRSLDHLSEAESVHTVNADSFVSAPDIPVIRGGGEGEKEREEEDELGAKESSSPSSSTRAHSDRWLSALSGPPPMRKARSDGLSTFLRPESGVLKETASAAGRLTQTSAILTRGAQRYDPLQVEIRRLRWHIERLNAEREKARTDLERLRKQVEKNEAKEKVKGAEEENIKLLRLRNNELQGMVMKILEESEKSKMESVKAIEKANETASKLAKRAEEMSAQATSAKRESMRLGAENARLMKIVAQYVTVSCAVCLENDLSIGETLQCATCSKHYCKECVQTELKNILGNAIGDRFAAEGVRCFSCRRNESGKGIFSLATLFSFIDSDAKIDLARIVRHCEKMKKGKQCARCNVRLEPDVLKCENCRITMCNKCNLEAHGDLSCEDALAKHNGQTNKSRSYRLVNPTAKACPACNYAGLIHYQGHECHHVTCPTTMGGCGRKVCVACLKVGGGCDCSGIHCSNDIQDIIDKSEEGGQAHMRGCGCCFCPDCSVNKATGRPEPCQFCSGNCMVCTGLVPPGPKQLDDRCNARGGGESKKPDVSGEGTKEREERDAEADETTNREEKKMFYLLYGDQWFCARYLTRIYGNERIQYHCYTDKLTQMTQHRLKAKVVPVRNARFINTEIQVFERADGSWTDAIALGDVDDDLCIPVAIRRTGSSGDLLLFATQTKVEFKMVSAKYIRVDKDKMKGERTTAIPISEIENEESGKERDEASLPFAEFRRMRVRREGSDEPLPRPASPTFEVDFATFLQRRREIHRRGGRRERFIRWAMPGQGGRRGRRRRTRFCRHYLGGEQCQWSDTRSCRFAHGFEDLPRAYVNSRVTRRDLRRYATDERRLAVIGEYLADLVNAEYFGGATTTDGIVRAIFDSVENWEGALALAANVEDLRRFIRSHQANNNGEEEKAPEEADVAILLPPSLHDVFHEEVGKGPEAADAATPFSGWEEELRRLAAGSHQANNGEEEKAPEEADVAVLSLHEEVGKVPEAADAASVFNSFDEEENSDVPDWLRHERRQQRMKFL